MVRGWLRRSWPERRALLEAALLLGVARAGLASFSFRRVLAWTERLGGPAGGDPRPDLRLERRLRAVAVVGRRLFSRGPCLPQALVARVLARRAGRPAELRIGTRRIASGGIEAHAWVESGGRVIMGDLDDLHTYVPLAPASHDPGADGGPGASVGV